MGKIIYAMETTSWIQPLKSNYEKNYHGVKVKNRQTNSKKNY
jgi:hypothetical protein